MPDDADASASAREGASEVAKPILSVACELISLMSVIEGQLEITQTGLRFLATKEPAEGRSGTESASDLAAHDCAWSLDQVRRVRVPVLVGPAVRPVVVAAHHGWRAVERGPPPPPPPPSVPLHLPRRPAAVAAVVVRGGDDDAGATPRHHASPPSSPLMHCGADANGPPDPRDPSAALSPAVHGARAVLRGPHDVLLER